MGPLGDPTSLSRPCAIQTAYNVNLALAQLGLIEVVRVGDSRPNGKATEFRYFLSQSEGGAEEDPGIEI
jgi:hypothetical protein